MKKWVFNGFHDIWWLIELSIFYFGDNVNGDLKIDVHHEHMVVFTQQN